MLSNGPRSLPGCSDLLHHSFLHELLLYSERYGLLLAARHIREELLDTGEDGADDPLLLLCLEEAEADDEVEVEDGVVEVVEVGFELVQAPPLQVQVGLAEHALDKALGRHFDI